MPISEGKSDWERVRREQEANVPIPYHPEDELYDPNDDAAVEAAWAPVLEARRAARGQQKAPVKKQVTLRISQDVLEHYRATGKGWQARMDEALRKQMAG